MFSRRRGARSSLHRRRAASGRGTGNGHDRMEPASTVEVVTPGAALARPATTRPVALGPSFRLSSS